MSLIRHRKSSLRWGKHKGENCVVQHSQIWSRRGGGGGGGGGGGRSMAGLIAASVTLLAGVGCAIFRADRSLEWALNCVFGFHQHRSIYDILRPALASDEASQQGKLLTWSHSCLTRPNSLHITISDNVEGTARLTEPSWAEPAGIVALNSDWNNWNHRAAVALIWNLK